MASFAAIVIGWVRRVPITYWLMDLNPDQAIALGKVAPRGPLAWAMRWLNRRIFARADAVVVLDRFMAERVRRQYKVRGRLEILSPWPHVECGRQLNESAIRNPKSEIAENPFIAQHQLAGRFVVMYSGNHSPANPVTTLLEAALSLRDDPRFVFAFVGGGLGKRAVEQAIHAHRLANIVSLPYQPLEQIQHSLSAADLHVVTLGDEMVGIIHPCKIYGAMAIGRPVLLIGPQPSHAADLIDRHAIGWRVNQGDVAGTIATLREIADTPQTALAEMGDRGRAAVRQHYEKNRLCAAFCEITENTLAPDEIHETVTPRFPVDRLEPVAIDALRAKS
jgi:glycosyltransferase involved in cell wall biosynthesis